MSANINLSRSAESITESSASKSITENDFQSKSVTEFVKSIFGKISLLDTSKFHPRAFSIN